MADRHASSDAGSQSQTDFESVNTLLLDAAAVRGADTAFRFLDGRGLDEIGWAELSRRALNLAARLRQHGRPGDRALIVAEPGIDYVVALFGILLSGLVAVPSFPPSLRRHAATLAMIAADCEPVAIVGTVASLDGVGEWSAAVPIATDEDTDPIGIEAFRPGADDLALLQYTSGSTASPKGVMLRHGNVMDNLERQRTLYGISAESRGVIWLPPHHDMGLFSGILQPLYAGSAILLMSPMFTMQRPLRWLQAISDFGATVSGGPSFAFASCAAALAASDLGPDELDLSSWTCAFVGAEPISADQLQAFTTAAGPFGFRPDAWTPSYGLAEASVLVSGRRGLRTRTDRAGRVLVDCGPVVDGHELLIVEPHGRHAVASGEEGEIWVRGPGIAAGYWGSPDRGAGTFTARLADGRGPFLRTGDLGCLRDGQLTITGRLKDIIILAGRKLHAGDIEEVARDAIGGQPAFGALAAFAVEVGGLERLVLAAEAPRSVCADTVTQRRLRSVLRGSMAAHFGVPLHDAVFTRHKLPRTSSGKLKRFDCRRRYMRGEWSQTLEVA